MKTKDRIKEEIGLEKLLLTIVTAMFSSVVSWLFNHIESNLVIQKAVMFLIAISLFTLASIFFTKITAKIKNLDLYE